MLRSIIAVTIGVLIGSCIVIFASFIVMQMVPVPADIDPNARDVMKKLPLANQFGVILVWFFGTFSGALAAGFIGRRWAPAIWVVAATMALFAISNLASYPPPFWMAAATFGLIGGGGFSAVKLTKASYGKPVEGAPRPGL